MLNIAIDGTAGSGKSALAKGIARKLNIKRLNTGALYRGIACEYDSFTQEEPNDEIVEKFAKDLELKVSFNGEEQNVIVNGTNYTQNLKLEKISILTAKIAQFSLLREKVLKLQREFASNNDCVMEGRDICSGVLPNAQVKIFLTASPEKRAQRRYEELKNKPNPPTFEEVLRDLKERDYSDEHRKIAPLKQAKDAVKVDNSEMNLQQTIDFCVELIEKKLEKANR